MSALVCQKKIVAHTIFDRMSAWGAHVILGARGEVPIRKGTLSRGMLVKYCSKNVDTIFFEHE